MMANQKRKIICIFVIFCISLSLFSCKVRGPQDEVAQNISEEQSDNETDLKTYDENNEVTQQALENDFITHGGLASDVFCGTVIAKEYLSDIPNYKTIAIVEDGNTTDADFLSINYTVKVEKMYRKTYVSEATYITVNHLVNTKVSTPKEKEPWHVEYEVGKKYIFSTRPDINNNDPIMLESKNMTAHISDDGILSPMASVSEWFSDAYKTLEQFESDTTAQTFFKQKYEYIKQDGKFYQDTRSEEEIIEYISNAIVVKDPIK